MHKMIENPTVENGVLVMQSTQAQQDLTVKEVLGADVLEKLTDKVTLENTSYPDDALFEMIGRVVNNIFDLSIEEATSDDLELELNEYLPTYNADLVDMVTSQQWEAYQVDDSGRLPPNPSIIDICQVTLYETLRDVQTETVNFIETAIAEQN